MIFQHSLRSIHALLAATALLGAGLASTAHGQTTLTAGEVVILGFNMSNPDSISVGLLSNVAAGTVFTLTDNGWATAGGFGATSEGTLTFTAPADLRAGTVLSWQNGGGGNSAGFGTATTNFSLNASNDQLIIVRGAASAVTTSTSNTLLVYAVQSDTTSPNAWDADRTSAATSARPTLSSSPDLAPVLGDSNAAYSGTLTATNKAGWLTRLANTGTPAGTGGNWTISPNALTLPTVALAVVTSLTWNPAGAGGSTAWSSATASTNWHDGTRATWFNPADLVAFTNTGFGAVTIAAGGVTPGAVSFTHTSGTYTISGGPIAGPGALSVSGGGTVILTGDHTFTGATTISNGRLEASGAGSNAALGRTSQVTVLTGGTLLLGASNQLNDTAKVALGGGTLDLNGQSEGALGTAGVGALTLSATSTLDFGGTGASNLIQFSGIDAHTAGTVLQVVNWGGTDHLLFSGNDPGAFSSFFGPAEVSFNGVAGYQLIDLGNYYEVAAIPEPATVAGGCLLAAAAAWRERRRLRSWGRTGNASR